MGGLVRLGFVGITLLLAGCVTTREHLEIHYDNGNVVVYDKETHAVLATGHAEQVYDEFGRPVWRFTVDAGPHGGESYDFPDRQSALDRLPDLLRNGIWITGDYVTEEQITDILDTVKEFWQDPVPATGP
jgi:hypothetical protein